MKKTSYILFFLSALMFVARPFIGFSVANLDGQLVGSHSLLAKSFSKRKPEDLEDAKTKATAIQQKLNHPPQNTSLTIIALLVLFSPVVFWRNTFTGKSFLNNIKANLLPAEHPYLLIGKLTI